MKTVPRLNANGNPFEIDSTTMMKRFDIGRGVTEEWHRDAETGEIVILETWRVMDGDCVSSEFEITEVIPKGGMIAELKSLLEEKTLSL